MGDRRKSRELALQALYQRDVTGEHAAPAVERFLRHFGADDDTIAFALALVLGVMERAEDIDGMIKEACENWRFERLSRVDLGVMRLATYELLATPDVPVNVVINEAIEIARRFGTEESAAFVNGVLDAIAERAGAKRRNLPTDTDGRALPPRSS